MKKIKICLLAAVCTLCLTGCNYQIEEDITGMEPPSSAPAEMTESEASEFQIEFVPNRISIAEYKSQYADEVNEIKESSYDRLNFQDCEIAPLGDVEKVGIYRAYAADKGVDKSIETIKNWLEEIGYGDIDLEKELRDASGQYERNESKAYPYDYPTVYDHYPEFDSGRGFFINTNQCYIQMGSDDGIHSMSDGSITAFLGLDSRAGSDAIGSNQKDLVDEGSVSEKKDDVWELVEGELSIGEGAKLVKDYFEAGAAGPYPLGVSLDVPEVAVFALNDKYGYAFVARRIYNRVPFTYENGSRHYYDSNCNIQEDGKDAFIIGGNTVAAFVGYDVYQMEALIEEQTEIMSLKDAASLLDDFWALTWGISCPYWNHLRRWAIQG